jgi:WD40 repeat protein
MVMCTYAIFFFLLHLCHSGRCDCFFGRGLSSRGCQEGLLMASGSSDNTVKIWNTEDGRCVRTLQVNMLTSLYFLPFYLIVYV